MQVSNFVPRGSQDDSKTIEPDVFVNFSHFLHTVRVKKESQEAK